MERPHLDLAFVSDVACPWCAIGLASLDKALDRVRGDLDISVKVEPFELNPDMGPEGAEITQYVARKYGRTPEQIAQIQPLFDQQNQAKLQLLKETQGTPDKSKLDQLQRETLSKVLRLLNPAQRTALLAK